MVIRVSQRSIKHYIALLSIINKLLSIDYRTVDFAYQREAIGSESATQHQSLECKNASGQADFDSPAVESKSK